MGRSTATTGAGGRGTRPLFSRGSGTPGSAGDETWESFPELVKGLVGKASPAVLAELRGKGLDLSEEPLDLSVEELAAISQRTLLVSSEDSPDALRRVNDRLAEALPHTEKVLVTGGHLIDPAHPVVLDFVGRIRTPSGQVDR